MPIIVQTTPQPNILTIYENNTVAISSSNAVNLTLSSSTTKIAIEQGVTRIVHDTLIGPQGVQGIQGIQGVDVVSSNIDVNGHLILTMSDASVIDAGNVVGPEGPAGSGSGVQGGIFITDVTPTSSGIVGQKLWDATTVPSNVVVNEAVSDTEFVRVHIIVVGAGAPVYTPGATIDGFTVTNFVEDSSTKRYYTGYYDINVVADRIITADNLDGGFDTVLIKRAAAGPTISQFNIGAYPGSQTQLKSGDFLPVDFVVENSATSLNVISSGAHSGIASISLGANDSGGVGFKTATGTISMNGTSGSQILQAIAYNSLGTAGNTMDSASVAMNQTYPSVILNSITYPVGQQALKNSETADVDVTVTNFDSVSYTSTNTSIPLSTTYSQVKTITRTSGQYINSGTNYQVVANRAANDASTQLGVLVVIANVAPDASISGGPVFSSSPTGIDYTINIIPDQILLVQPSLVSDKGTWLGVWSNNSRLLRIDDAVVKGVGSFSSLQVTGLSGLVGTLITAGSSFTVRGFQSRVITFAAFSQLAPIGTNVHTIANTSSSYSGGSSLTLQSSTVDTALGYTIVDSNGVYSPTGNYLWISDAAFAGSNTSGTLQLDLQEIV